MSRSVLSRVAVLLILGVLLAGAVILYKKRQVGALEVRARESILHVLSRMDCYAANKGTLDAAVAEEHPHAWRAAFSSVGLTGGNFDEDLYDHTVLRAVARVPPFDADGPQRSELRNAAEEVGVDIDER